MSNSMTGRRPSWPLTVLLFLAVGCGGAKATEPPKGEKARAPRDVAGAASTRVEVAVLQPSTASLSSTVPGEVEGSREATLASALGGPVERILVKEGDQVKRGQLLMLVDAALYSIQVRQAETRLRSVDRELKRSEGLGSALATAERDRRQAQVDAANEDLSLAKLQLSRSRIVAPFAGVVAEIHTEVGEVVGATAPLIDLVQLDPVHVVMSVPDRDLAAIKLDSEVEVRVAALPQAFSGKVSRISATGDRDTRAFEAEVAVQNGEGQLKPGMIASVRLDQSVADGVVVIPQDWLVTRRDGVGVFLDEEGKARFVAVTPGQVVRDQVIVQDGLDPGNRLVIKGHRNLADGDLLSVAREGVCCTQGRVRFD